MIVPHCFAAVAGAALILVLDQGRLVEAGSLEPAPARSTAYAKLFSLQQTAFAAQPRRKRQEPGTARDYHGRRWPPYPGHC